MTTGNNVSLNKKKCRGDIATQQFKAQIIAEENFDSNFGTQVSSPSNTLVELPAETAKITYRDQTKSWRNWTTILSSSVTQILTLKHNPELCEHEFNFKIECNSDT